MWDPDPARAHLEQGLLQGGGGLVPERPADHRHRPVPGHEYKKDEYVRLVTANKSYWRGAPKIDEVIFQNYQNTDTMAQDLKTGNLQAAVGIPQAQFGQLGKAPLTSIKGATS
jgi:hypothetical protein